MRQQHWLPEVSGKMKKNGSGSKQTASVAASLGDTLPLQRSSGRTGHCGFSVWAGVEDCREAIAFSIALREGSTSKAGALSQPEWWLKKATQGEVGQRHVEPRRLVKNATQGSQMSLKQRRRARQTQLPTRSSAWPCRYNELKQTNKTHLLALC